MNILQGTLAGIGRTRDPGGLGREKEAWLALASVWCLAPPSMKRARSRRLQSGASLAQKTQSRRKVPR